MDDADLAAARREDASGTMLVSVPNTCGYRADGAYLINVGNTDADSNLLKFTFRPVRNLKS